MLNGVFCFLPKSHFLGWLSIRKILVPVWGKSKALIFCPVDRWVLEGVKRSRKDLICFWGKVAGHDSIGIWNWGEKVCQSLCLFFPVFHSAMPTATPGTDLQTVWILEWPQFPSSPSLLTLLRIVPLLFLFALILLPSSFLHLLPLIPDFFVLLFVFLFCFFLTLCLLFESERSLGGWLFFFFFPVLFLMQISRVRGLFQWCWLKACSLQGQRQRLFAADLW